MNQNQGVIITVAGDELVALVESIQLLDRCEHCDGEPTLIVDKGGVEAIVPHLVDCPVTSELIGYEIDQDWRELNGDAR